MIEKIQGKSLQIYIGENDHHHGKPLYAAIIERAKEAGLSGATACRAMMGYGAHSRIHSTNMLSISEDLPVVITLIDTEEKIEGFVASLEELISEGTMISYGVQVEILRTGH